MDKQIMLVKKFTGIDRMQAPRKVSYSILWSASGTRYGVAVEEEQNGLQYGEQETNLLNDKELAQNLLMFLYENAVGANALHDIVQDLKVRGVFEEK